MPQDRTARLAASIVVATGALWGFYWLPVRQLADAGLAGAWGTFAVVAAAAGLLAPTAIRRRRRLAAADRRALAAIALGGAAFVLYSVGFVYGRVAIVIILFFLTPVWSTLIGRYVMGWPTSPLRVGAIAVGLAGLAVMLGADGMWPLPRTSGEWLALVSGILWSIATTGIRSTTAPAPAEAAFVFALGGAIGALALAPLLAPWPAALDAAAVGPALALAAVTGGLWWGLSMVSLMWATARLEPARVGILLMAEVLVGALSAALLAGEHLGRREMLGGVLILSAGILELWPSRSEVRHRSS
jgi:drug/metabolite transporter (DMT)-like permease